MKQLSKTKTENAKLLQWTNSDRNRIFSYFI